MVQYNIDAITGFIEDKLSDLSLTYSVSQLPQLRCLLGSIFLSGLVWGYPGISNREISSCYQAIRDFDDEVVKFGEPDRIRTCDQELKRLLLYR